MTKPAGTSWALFTLLLIRGLALWVVVPVGVLLWIVALPLSLMKRIPLGALLGWIDLNLLALIQRALRPWMHHLGRWVPVSQIRKVEHRIRWFDPF